MKKNLKSVLCIVFLAVSLFGIVGCKDDEKFDSSAKIQLYTRDKTSGTRDGFFTNIHFTDAVSDNSVLGSGILEAKNNGAMVESVKNDEYGIGYISLSSLKDSGLKGLIYEGVAPTEENVLTLYGLHLRYPYLRASEFYCRSVLPPSELHKPPRLPEASTAAGLSLLKSHQIP